MQLGTALCLALAGALAVLGPSGRLPRSVPTVLLAYGLGLALGLAGAVPRADRPLVRTLMEACVALAIPALLLGADRARFRGVGRGGLLGGLVVLTGALTAAAAVQISGLASATDTALVLAIFTGSLANLQAAGLALAVDDSVLVAANLGDVAIGGLGFLLLLAGAPLLAARLDSRARRGWDKPEASADIQDRLRGRGTTWATASAKTPGGRSDPSPSDRLTSPPLQTGPRVAQRARSRREAPERHSEPGAPAVGGVLPKGAYGMALCLAGVCVAVGLGLAAAASVMLPQAVGVHVPRELLVIGGATALALALANHRRVARVVPAAASLGEGLLLGFCVLVGTLAEWSQVGWAALQWAGVMGVFLIVQIGVALALAWGLRLGGGAWLLALTGAVYSPAFVGPIAQAADRRDLVPVGVAVGLLGLASATPLALLWVRAFA